MSDVAISLPIRFMQHAVERFRSRVRPGFGIEQAQRELTAVAAKGRITAEVPAWLGDRPRHRHHGGRRLPGGPVPAGSAIDAATRQAVHPREADLTASLNNPSLAMAANAYHRQYGEWPTWVRFTPDHFAHWTAELDADALVLLGTVLDVSVTAKERSPRLSVGGPDGEVTSEKGVTEADWDQSPFEEWLAGEAAKL